MECATIRKLLSEYMDDTLDSNTKACLEDHLVTCKGCTEELASLKALVQELHSLEPVEAPEDFLDRLHERMEPRFQFRKILRMLFVPARIKIPLEFATVAAMAVLVFFIVHMQEVKKQFLDMPKGTPPERFAEQNMRKPSQPDLKREPHQARSSFDDVTVTQPAEETQSIELALLLETDLSGKTYTPRAAVEAEPRPEKEVKTTEKEGDWQGTPNVETHTDDIKQEEENTEVLFMPRLALKDKDERSDVYLNETLSKVKHLIAQSKGRITSVEYAEETEQPQSIYAEIPAEHYRSFSEELARIAPLRSPSSIVSEKDQKVIPVRIRFISSP